MADTKNFVTTGKPKVGGAVSRAAIGTTLPVNAYAPLEPAFKSMGTINEDGVTNENSRTVEDIKDWEGNTVLSPQTEKKDTFKMSFMDSKKLEVLQAIYHSENVSGTLDTGITVKVNAKELETYAWVIDMVTTGGDPKRIVIPRGKITEIGEISYKSGEAVLFESTITAYPDESGNTHYEYLMDKEKADAALNA